MANQQSKNIQYSGLTTLPDDYQSVDGSLAFATNAVYEDNAVKIIPPALAKNLIVQKGDKVYVHSMATYTHYIVVHGGSDGVTLYWVDEKPCEEKKVYCVTDAENGVDNNPDAEGIEFGPVFTIGTYPGTFVDLAFVGNTMILSTSESLQYVLWKSDVQNYVYLGDGIPKVDVQFQLGLNVEFKEYQQTQIWLETKNKGSRVELSEAETLAEFSMKQPATVHSVTIDDILDVRGELLELAGGYRYTFREMTGPRIPFVWIYGKKKDVENAGYELLGSNTNKSVHCAFDVSSGNDYTNIRVKVEFAYQEYDQSDTFTIERTAKLVEVDTLAVKNTSENYTGLMGYVNKFVNDYGKKADRFIYPFFVRYAVKLYDGSYSRVSSPIFMIPNSGNVPIVTPCYRVTNDGNAYLQVMAFSAGLQYKVVDSISEDWSDIITGIEVFASEPIYTYDQGQGYEEENFDELVTYKHYGVVGKDDDGNDQIVDEISGTDYGAGFYELDTEESDTYTEAKDERGYGYIDLIARLVDNYQFLSSTIRSAWNTIEIAAKDVEDIEKEICETANFYKIKEVKFDEIPDTESFVLLELEEGTLSSLEARERLEETVISSDGFSNANFFTYNNRLQVFGGENVLPAVTPPELQNGRVVTYTNEDCYVKIKSSEGIKVVYCGRASCTNLPWFFYPDTGAYEFVEMIGDTWFSRSLSEHEFLNGAYFFRGFESLTNCLVHGFMEYMGAKGDYDGGDETQIEGDPAPEDNKLSNLNKIYVSEASNPFVFKNSMVCTAGSGQVLALSSAAKALSQGQFGQFPLYAFTDEGIWAMSVGSTGAYETVQPIARDVVPTDAVKAITQLDSAVVFVTDRGVMLVEGSNVVCMSDDIDGDFGQFDPRALSGFYDIMKRHLGFSTDDTDNTIGKWASQAFFDFIRSCRMKYDYVHQRITMYSDDCDMAYVYSLKSKQWLMQLTALQDNVNSYPDAYALRNTDAVGGVACTELVNLSEYDLETERLPMVFVTRPFKLDAPDTFKTVNDIIQRGYFRQDEQVKHIIGTTLYGSPDLFNWFAVKSNEGHKIQNLHGSPYKYFRVLVVSRLDAKEGISGCSVWFEPKDTQRLR